MYFPSVMAHILNFAPVVDVAADVTQFLISLESFMSMLPRAQEYLCIN